MSGFFDIAGPLIRLLDAERAHGLAIKALKTGLVPAPNRFFDSCLQQQLFGLDFANPTGLAPGFDKNAEVPDAMLAQGFGFVEVGTVTPRAQAGNAKPRLFRLSRDRAVINRMGFNNDGHAVVAARLHARTRHGIVGVNIGANKTSDDRTGDYVAGIKAFHALADYLTVNISSPNTPGLRGLQSRAQLSGLLQRLNEARAQLGSTTPMLLKIAPDLIDDELYDICEVCSGGAVDGLIISNTTLARDGLHSAHANEQGGLSGQPLFELSTRILAKAARATQGKLPLVGVGGISDAAQAYEKIRAGASLVQLYTAMVYKGPGLANCISRDLAKLLAKHNFTSVSDAIGSGIADWL